MIKTLLKTLLTVSFICASAVGAPRNIPNDTLQSSLQGSAPSSPTSGTVKSYFLSSDGFPYWKTSGGSVFGYLYSSSALTNHGILLGAGTRAPAAMSVGGSGTVLQGVAASDPAFTLTPVLGVAGASTGTLGLSGLTSGVVTIQPQSAAGTYNFNLPVTAGSSGQPLLSAGGGSSPMTFGTLGVAGGGSGLATRTNHAVQVGAGTSAITQVGPNASTAFPLVSGGSSADPSYALLTVPGGGTGLATLTAHAVYVGNGTSAPTALSVGANNQVLRGSTGADPAFGSLVGADLPNPSSSTLGGIQSAAAQSNKWINSISTSGVPSLTQPAFTDISGSVAASQMPALTGDITTSAGAVATTLATVNSNVGSFTNANITVNAKGLVTAASNGTGGSGGVPTSEVIVTAGNGHGSTNNKIRRYSTTALNTGSNITYADSSTNGGSFTINASGIYTMCWFDDNGGGTSNIGVTVNGSALTTSLRGLTYAQGKRAYTSPAASQPGTACWTGHLVNTDVVRAQDDGTPNETQDAFSMFSIVQVN